MLVNKCIQDLASLLFPQYCVCCSLKLVQNEDFICLNCLAHIPRTNYHNIRGNPVEILFWGRAKVERAVSFYTFKEGSKYKALLHSLKYKGMCDLGTYLGKLYAAEINHSGFFNDIDLIVPVPLHHKRLKKRGYNQSEYIVDGIAKITGIKKSIGNLYRQRYNKTQTKKGRYERWQNVDGLFDVKNTDEFKGKHVLLVDDVVTTGATTEACIQAIHKNGNVKVSFLSLAYAML